MTPLPQHLGLDEPTVYRISIQGRLDTKWTIDFPTLEIQVRKTNAGLTYTCLTGRLPDQASLHGLLNRIRDYSLVLLGLEILNLPLNDNHMENQ